LGGKIGEGGMPSPQCRGGKKKFDSLRLCPKVNLAGVSNEGRGEGRKRARRTRVRKTQTQSLRKEKKGAPNRRTGLPEGTVKKKPHASPGTGAENLQSSLNTNKGGRGSCLYRVPGEEGEEHQDWKQKTDKRRSNRTTVRRGIEGRRSSERMGRGEGGVLSLEEWKCLPNVENCPDKNPQRLEGNRGGGTRNFKGLEEGKVRRGMYALLRKKGGGGIEGNWWKFAWEKEDIRKE